MSDAPLTLCPACGKETLTKLVSAAGFQLKGSGWYATDFKGGPKRTDKEEGAKADTKSGDDAKSSRDSDVKVDTKAKDDEKGKGEVKNKVEAKPKEEAKPKDEPKPKQESKPKEESKAAASSGTGPASR